MIMATQKDYSRIRGHITSSIRQIEALQVKSKDKFRPDAYLNEYDYWLSSLQLLRNCLYGCIDEYSGQINIDYAIIELKSEITNFIKVVQKLEPWELAYLDRAWKRLKDIEEMLV